MTDTNELVGLPAAVNLAVRTIECKARVHRCDDEAVYGCWRCCSLILASAIRKGSLVPADTILSLRGAVQRAVDHFDARSELYTSDADTAAGMADILRAALNGEPTDD